MLLLDEPTNHLDLETREALTMALAQFEGTMIVVSHDRHLLRATADNFLLVGNGKIEPFDGDLDDYRNWLLQHAADKRNEAKGIVKAAAEVEKENAKRAAAAKAAELDPAARKEQKRQEAEARQQLAAQRKPLQNELAKLEKSIATLTADKQRVEALLADESTYSESNKSLLSKSLREQVEVSSKLEEAEMRWLELHEQLEGLAA